MDTAHGTSRQHRPLRNLVALLIVACALLGSGCGTEAEDPGPLTPTELAAGLDDEDPAVRAAALVGLRSVADSSAETRSNIVRLGMDPEEGVRYEAVLTLEALHHEGDDAIFGMLTHVAMSDASAANRAAARQAMDNLIGSALSELRKAAHDPQRRELIGAGRVLWDEEFEIELLESAEMEVQGGDPEDWVDGALVLKQFGDRGVAAALRILGEALESGPDVATRVRAAQALGELGRLALPLLDEVKAVAADELRSDDVRQAARDAARRIGAE